MRVLLSLLGGLLLGLFNSWVALGAAAWLEGRYLVVVSGCLDSENCGRGWAVFLICALMVPTALHVFCFVRMRATLGINVRTAAMLLMLCCFTAIWFVAGPIVQILLSR